MKKFTGTLSFLSNMYNCSILYEGLIYSSVECAYQAQKTTDIKERHKISTMSSYEAKRYAKSIKLRDDWDDVKLSIMETLLNIKFSNVFLLRKLKQVDDKDIFEGNYWHDNYWGICSCSKCKGKGEDNLGKLLREIKAR